MRLINRRDLICIINLKLNNEYILDIDSMGVNGEGIAHIDGYTLFISGGVTGDKLRARVTKLNKSYGFASLTEIVSPSPIRVDPICPFFSECGGCQLMNISYNAQTAYKRQLIKDALLRIGGIDTEVDFVSAKNPLRYRNKAVFPFSESGDWGFYKRGSHEVVKLNDCHISDELNAPVLNLVRDFCESRGIKPYDETTHSGVLRRVFTRTSSKTGDMMVVISINADSIPDADVLAKSLRELSPRIASVILNINKKKTNLVLGEKNITLYGDGKLKDSLLGLDYEISPHSFFQINHAQTELLYRKALEYASISENSTVFDIYCGIGTISLSAALSAKTVVGIEIVSDAIENAKKNAKYNKIKNASFYCGAAEEVTPRLIESGILPDTVILDPPRKGSDVKTLTAILKAEPKRIVYVSCNPATLARDLAFLTKNGYKTASVTGFDLFPQTCHAETVALLIRQSR